MKVVIQCAGKKTSGAGFLAGSDGVSVHFVARPELAPFCPDKRHARPDDPAANGKTWRDILRAHNLRADKSLNLLRAYQLYQHPIYTKLVEKFGAGNVFILSAGWGLVGANFLLPAYDITFSSAGEKFSHRKRQDTYDDFSMLPDDCDDDLVFFGGKDYQRHFHRISKNYRGNRFVFYNSAGKPDMPDCRAVKYKTETRTNWHYECAAAFINGAISLPA